MRNLIVFAILMLSAGSVMADEYNQETYNGYGFGSAASVLNLGLKAGLRGSHVAPDHSRENAYYPGFIAGEAKEVALFIHPR